MKQREVCEKSRIELGINDIHEHLSIQSPTQAKRCKWLLHMELNLVVDFLWTHLDSHSQDVEEGTIL
jgi:hypothetical protein